MRWIAEKWAAYRLHRIPLAHSPEVGVDFFRTLVKELAGLLGVDCVVVGRFQPREGREKFRSVALWQQGGHRENVICELADSPCAETILGRRICYPENVAARFPESGFLKRLGAESYAGHPLYGRDNEVIGVLAVVDGRPLRRRRFVASILSAVAARAASELERFAADEKLRILSQAIEQSPNTVMVTDVSGTIQYVNPSFSRVTGYESGEALGCGPVILQSGKTPHGVYEEIWSALRAGESWRGELHNRRKSGDSLWESAVISPVRDEEGRIRHFLKVAEDITGHKMAEKKLSVMAYYDPLTGLPNRRLFVDRLGRALARNRRRMGGLAVLSLNLDNFHTVNSALGHASGDRLLQEVARRIADALRQTDTVARVGSDSFQLLLDDIDDGENGAGIARQILRAVEQPLVMAGGEVSMSASIGVAVYPEDGDSAARLQQHADAARQRVKEEGGGNYRFFTPAMNERALGRMTLESELRKALVRGEFTLHFQPQIAVGTGRVVGAEALLRWAHLERGLLAPVHFIGLAEETGLIRELGRMVLGKACRQAAKWRQSGLGLGRVSVNLSAPEFADLQLPDRVEQVLGETQLPPQALSLELTETALMQDLERARKTLGALKELGVHIAVDDFGTGYCSLSYLKHLPVDMLKIDRSFLKDVPGSTKGCSLVAAIIAMGRNLGLRVLTEGVTDLAQWRFLQAHGDGEMQGYYFSAPLPPVEFARYVREAAHLGDAVHAEAGHGS